MDGTGEISTHHKRGMIHRKGEKLTFLREGDMSLGPAVEGEKRGSR